MTEPHLTRGIGRFDATALVVGSMIGSGIFIVSAESSRVLGSPGWMLLAWVIAGTLTMIASLSCAELAAMLPKAGGQYVFFREAYGPLFGFLFGWTLFLVVQTGTIAAVAVAFARYLGVLAPAVSSANVLLSVGPVHLSSVQAVALAVVLLLTATNATGLKAGTLTQNVFTVAKFAALAALTVFGLALGKDGAALRSADLFRASAPSGEAGEEMAVAGHGERDAGSRQDQAVHAAERRNHDRGRHRRRGTRPEEGRGDGRGQAVLGRTLHDRERKDVQVRHVGEHVDGGHDQAS